MNDTLGLINDTFGFNFSVNNNVMDCTQLAAQFASKLTETYGLFIVITVALVVMLALAVKLDALNKLSLRLFGFYAFNATYEKQLKIIEGIVFLLLISSFWLLEVWLYGRGVTLLG